ncbi:MAG: PD40 domain-containing protein [Candidatus Aminicenantes bacterium]|nr:PD40 domain-containing protein [Candidatus Aminicenantes bacterium]
MNSFPKMLIGLVLSSLALFAAPLGAIDDARLLRNPDIFAGRIVFQYGGDLWTCPAAGGQAVQLTSHPGLESSPCFSPDGRWVAFSGQYDENMDVYIVPTAGGEPKRLTFHPGADQVTGWSHDGRSVLFSSFRTSSNRYARIFKVSVDGGMPEEMPMPMAWLGSMSADGRLFAYTSLSNRQSFDTWRRYRGGNAPFIWVFDLQSHAAEKIPQLGGNDTFPHFSGEWVYFLSDRDRVMNVYRYHAGSRQIEPLTSYDGVDIKSFGVHDGAVVFEREGRLHLLCDGKVQTLAVNIPSERILSRPGQVPAGELIFNAHVSPSGKRAVFEARGEIVTVPVEKGDIRNITRTPTSTEREPAWSPDGRSIAYFSDEPGEYALFIRDQQGTRPPKVIALPEKAYYHAPLWSPDGKRIVFVSNRQVLYLADVVAGRVARIAANPKFISYPDYEWSPDSQWLCYSLHGENDLRDLFLYRIADGKAQRLTDGMSDAYSPTFDKNGKYLYFAASTNLAHDMGWVDLSEYPHEPVANLYCMVLSSAEPSPLKAQSDEEEEKKEEKKDSAKEGKDAKKAPAAAKPVRIDLEGIGGRIVALPIPTRSYARLQAGQDKLYYTELVKKQRSEMRIDQSVTLYVYTHEKRESETLAGDIATFMLSADGKKMLYRQKRNWFVVDAAKVESGKGKLNTQQITVYREPQSEWRQILRDAWRIERDYFYDPGMHGQDWQAVLERYESYLPYVSHRDDLNYLIGQMIGELCVGHAYRGGGEQPRIKQVPVGLLGADIGVRDGRFFLKKIYRGESWNPELRSPLSEPGNWIAEGSYVLAVDGRKMDVRKNFYSHFLASVGRQVRLLISATPEKAGAREVIVVPVDNENDLRFREQIEENRKLVERLSQGKLGYVYLPDTAVGGYTFFNRYYFSQLQKQGMILDERFNGGGYAADYIIDLLRRPLMNYWKPRWGVLGKTPQAANFGPKAMLINEYAGSGGDAMPYYFKQQKIGPLIGKRTWGGLVGISGYPPLMDGGYVTAPTVAFVDTDGEFTVENEGVAPDIEVEWTPAEVIAGRDPQLEKAVAYLLEELRKSPPRKFEPKPFPRGR